MKYKVKTIRKNKICRAAICLSLSLVLVISCTVPAYAWGNGGANRTTWQRRHVEEKPSFTDYKAFTINVEPVTSAAGHGIGTHDLILEQAIAQAIYKGADVSWINVSKAQQATSDPDYIASVQRRFYFGGDYRGFRAGGTGPLDIGVIYYEIADALNKGDRKTASKKLGWMAHYLGDITQPFHNANATQYRAIKSVRQHAEHLAFELDLSYYMENTVGFPKSRWFDDLKVVTKRLPEFAEVTNETTPQNVRLLWFGGKYKKPAALTKSARQIAISASKKIRDNYTTDALKAWAKTWKKGKVYETNPETHSSRGSGTTWLLENASGMMSTAATNLAKLIVALSDPATRSVGIDHISKPIITIKKDKLSKKLTKKYQSATATFTIKSNKGKGLYEFPIRISWKDEGKKKVVKSALLWTNKSGKVSSSITVKKRMKSYKLSVSVSAPTSDYRTTVKKIVKIEKKPKKKKADKKQK